MGFLSFFLFAAAALFAENPSPADIMPSLLVNQMVCPVSGNVSLLEQDAQAWALEPITIDRMISDSQNWRMGHGGSLIIDVLGWRKELWYAAHYRGAYGQSIYFYTPYNVLDLNKFVFNEYMVELGLSNIGGKEISGRSNLKNCKLREDEKGIVLSTGSGLRTYFKEGKIDEQYLPNSYRLSYQWTKKGKLAEVTTRTASGKKLASANYTHESNKTKIELSNGANVVYLFDKHQRLLSAERSDSPKISYEFDKYYLDYLAKRKLPDNRWVGFEYYSERYSDINVYHPETLRVKNILAPAHADGSSLVTHYFSYEFDEDNHEVQTTVENAKGQKTLYTGLRGRIASIQCYKKDNKSPYKTEKFIWGDHESVDGGNLLRRTCEDSQGRVLFVKTYRYDKRGNPLEESLYGNISGKSPLAVVCGVESLPKDQQEHKTIRKEFIKKFNLLRVEDDGRKRWEYSYHDQTDLIAKRLTWVAGEIRERCFFEYDENNALIREINDDGNSSEKDDLTGVTERHIHVRIYKDSCTALPDEEEERVLDRVSGVEKLLLRKQTGYDARGRPILQKYFDQEGVFTFQKSWEYSPHGSITKEIDPLGHEIHRTYDANLNLITESGPLFDHTKHFFYDFMNRLIRVEDRFENEILTTHTKYNVLGQKKYEIDIYGNETHYKYDCHGREIEIELPVVLIASGEAVSPKISKTYDTLGFIHTLTDAGGNSTQTLYTILGKPYHILYPDGTTESWEYNLEGEITRHIAVNGLVTAITRDWKGRPEKTDIFSKEGLLLSTQTAVYNTFHLLSEVDPMGHVTEYSYDLAGRLIRVEKEGEVSEIAYDTRGRVSEKRKGNILVEKFIYDVMDRVIEERKEDLHGNILLIVQREYDALGRKIKETVGDQTTFFYYNAKGELTKQCGPGENQRIFFVDHHFLNSLGQRVKKTTITDSMGNVIEVENDALGRECQTTRKDAFSMILQKETKSYDLAGHLVKSAQAIIHNKSYEKEFLVAFDYDSVGRLTAVTEAQGTREEKISRYIYNSLGQKKKLIKPDGVCISYTYDDWGRIKTEKSSDNTIHYSYTYDVLSRVISTKDILHGTETCKFYDVHSRMTHEALASGLEVRNTYDALGRVIKIEHQAGAAREDCCVEYFYDAVFLRKIAWNEKEIHYDRFDTSGRLLEGANHRYTYDSSGRLVQWVCGDYKESCKYDLEGNLIQRELFELSTNYDFDALYQLTHEKRGHEKGGYELSYSHDSLYNRRQKNNDTCKLNSLHQILACGNLSYEWDRNGNMTARIKDGVREDFIYDARDRLITLRKANEEISYFWDEQNRRLKKDDTCFFFQGNNEVGSFSEGERVEFRVLGIGKGAEIGAAVFMELNHTVYKPLHDTSGNVIALLDDQGALVERYNLSAFGEEESSPNLSNPWRFSSKRHDPESGLVLFGRRFYDPATGRFTTADPLGYSAGPNLYAFCCNSPLTHFDLYGLETSSSFFDNVIDICSNVRDWVVDSFNSVRDALRDTFNSISSGVQSVFNSVGSSINALSNYLPSPARDLGMTLGTFMQNGCLHQYTPIWREENTTLYYLSGKKCSHTRSVLINGIFTKPEEVFQRMYEEQEGTGGYDVWAIHIATHGLSNDLLLAGAERVGFPTHASQVVQSVLEDFVDKVGENGVVSVLAFSRGNLPTLNVGERWHDSGKTFGDKIHATLIATPKVPREKLFSHTLAVVNDADPIMIVDPLGYFTGSREHCHIIPSASTFPMGHSYTNDAYRPYIESRQEFLKKRYSSNL